MQDRRFRSLVTAFVTAALLLAIAALAAAALRATQPHLVGAPSEWRSDDLAFAVTWTIAAACTAWLALTIIAVLVALARGEVASASRLAAYAPPIVRRLLQTALVSTIVLAPTATYAAPPTAPYTLRVGPDGQVTRPPPRGPSRETPVVRTPSTTTPRTIAPYRTPPTTAPPTTAPPTTAPPTTAPPTTRPPSTTTTTTTVTKAPAEHRPARRVPVAPVVPVAPRRHAGAATAAHTSVVRA